MKELLLRNLQQCTDLPASILPAKTVKIHKITSIEAFKNSGLKFEKLRKAVMVGEMLIL